MRRLTAHNQYAIMKLSMHATDKLFKICLNEMENNVINIYIPIQLKPLFTLIVINVSTATH